MIYLLAYMRYMIHGSDNTPDTDTSTSESGDSDGENTETTTKDTTVN